MLIVFRLFFLVTSLGLLGCQAHVQHQWKAETDRVQPPKVAWVNQAPEPQVTVVTYEDSQNLGDNVLVDPISVKSQNIVSLSAPLSFEHDLDLKSTIYLSKAGELMADLTIENRNVVSVKQITIHCVEYNMNNSVVREASVTLERTLQVGESSYWDQVNFGYVHDAFETVQCEIREAHLS